MLFNFPACAVNVPQSPVKFCEPITLRRPRMTLYLACIATVVCCTMGANALYKFILSRREAADEFAAGAAEA
jgi:hypothetical protein